MYNNRTYREIPEHIVHKYVMYILGKSQRGKISAYIVVPRSMYAVWKQWLHHIICNLLMDDIYHMLNVRDH